MVGGTTTTYNIPDQIILLRLFIWHFTVGGILLDSNSVTSITVVVHNIIIIMLRYVFVASILNYHGVEYNQGELGSMSSLSGVLHSTEWLSSNRLQVHNTLYSCTDYSDCTTIYTPTTRVGIWENCEENAHLHNTTDCKNRIVQLRTNSQSLENHKRYLVDWIWFWLD